MNTRSREVIRAEQEVVGLEQRYWNTLGNLQPKEPSWDSITRTYRRERFAVLGTLDRVPIIETYQTGGGYKSERELAPNCSYDGRLYSLLTGVRARNAMALVRAIRLQDQGLDHIIGVVEGNDLYGGTLGIYVPSGVLEPMRNKHAEEIIRDYPSFTCNPAQIENLNISPSFVYEVRSKIKLASIDRDTAPTHSVKVKPVTDGWSFTQGRDFGFPDQVTGLYIHDFAAPGISFKDFFDGKRDSLLERIRKDIGATAYTSVAGYEEGPCDFLFRFNKVLSNQEIGQALQRLGESQNGVYSVTLHRLSNRLRGLINLPLDNTVRSPDENIQNLEKLINVPSARFVLGMY